jgi:hypothetical protein
MTSSARAPQSLCHVRDLSYDDRKTKKGANRRRFSYGPSRSPPSQDRAWVERYVTAIGHRVEERVKEA